MQCGRKPLLVGIGSLILIVALVTVYSTSAAGAKKNKAGLRGNGSIDGSGVDIDVFAVDKKPDYTESSWDDLPADIKDAGTTLGYTKDTWDGDAAHDKTWKLLSPSEKNAAKLIGYTRYTWNTEIYHLGTWEPTSSTSSSVSTFPFEYAGYMWDALPEHVQASAQYLGFTQDFWDNGVETLPLRENNGWQSLTKAQRQAAKNIGYGKHTWNDV